METKAIFLVFLIFLGLLVVIPFNIPKVLAYSNQYNLEFEWDEADYGLSDIGNEHPSATFERSSYGFTFTTSNNFYLGYVQFVLRKTGSPTSTLVSALYAESGGAPTGNPLAYSTTYESEDLTTSSLWITFNYTESLYMLSASTTYCISVEANTTNVDSSDYVHVRLSNVITASYGRFKYASNVWSAVTDTYDFLFRVYSLVDLQDLFFVNFANLELWSNSLEAKELSKTMKENVNVVLSNMKYVGIANLISESVGCSDFMYGSKSLVLQVTSSFDLFDWLAMWRECSFLSSALTQFSSSSGLGKEKGYLTSGLISFYDSVRLGKSLSITQFANFVLSGSSAMLSQLQAAQEYLFNLFANQLVSSSLSSGKGLLFSVGSVVSAFSSVAMTFESGLLNLIIVLVGNVLVRAVVSQLGGIVVVSPPLSDMETVMVAFGLVLPWVFAALLLSKRKRDDSAS